MADGSAGAAAATSNTMMINTMAGGGVKIGSNDAQIQQLVNDEITDEDEKRGVLRFLGQQEKKSKFRDRLANELKQE